MKSGRSVGKWFGAHNNTQYIQQSPREPTTFDTSVHPAMDRYLQDTFLKRERASLRRRYRNPRLFYIMLFSSFDLFIGLQAGIRMGERASDSYVRYTYKTGPLRLEDGRYGMIVQMCRMWMASDGDWMRCVCVPRWVHQTFVRGWFWGSGGANGCGRQ